MESTAQGPAVVIDQDVTPIISTQRETTILDSFIVIRSRQDMRSDESDLYLDNDDERYRDMFNYMQVNTPHFMSVTCQSINSGSLCFI